jgi:OHCU decarboxylase
VTTTESAGLRRFNGLPSEMARLELQRCCGSTAWVERMERIRPFATVDHLLGAADVQWKALPRSAWTEAFAAHPRIGSVRDIADASAGTRAWAEGEQSGARGASAATLAALVAANRDYEQKFGFIFLICATGKSADEMLAQCRMRYGHEIEVEMEIAAEEQRKITRLRLLKLIAGDPAPSMRGSDPDFRGGGVHGDGRFGGTS